MIRAAVKDHPGFKGCGLSVYAKGSYANNTNVRTDSDVDIAVQCQDVVYWDEASAGAHPNTTDLSSSGSDAPVTWRFALAWR